MTETAPSQAESPPRLLLPALLGLTLLMRLAGIGREDIWFDAWWSLRVAGETWEGMLRSVVQDFHRLQLLEYNKTRWSEFKSALAAERATAVVMDPDFI